MSVWRVTAEIVPEHWIYSVFRDERPVVDEHGRPVKFETEDEAHLAIGQLMLDSP